MATNINYVHVGEIWEVNFNPGVGDEMKKVRPAIVISSDSLGVLKNKIVVPVTGWDDKYDALLWLTKIEPDKVNKLIKISAADAMQLRSVSIERFIRKRGMVSAAILEEIKQSVAIIIEYI